MSDQNDDQSYEDEQSESPKGLRAALKAAQDRVKELEPQGQELAKLKRESVFRDVGLDLKKPQHSDFMKAYDGDLSEQAIREAAESRGYLEPPAPQVPQEETQAIDRIGQASVGAQPSFQGDQQAVMNALNQARTAQEYDQILAANGLLFTSQ